ncbi:MAG: phosphoenolpyruvate carboxykinase (ATP), partial [Bacteroidales bacterium]|nr:phosphoenolpyruvate carboxykinase (ATP) [Bacteroidales bacterium]
MTPIEKMLDTLKCHKDVRRNISRADMIAQSIANREVIVCESGALATWSRPESTGRSPKDTVIVKRTCSEKNIDWTSANNLPLDEKVFDMVLEDAIALLLAKP